MRNVQGVTFFTWLCRVQTLDTPLPLSMCAGFRPTRVGGCLPMGAGSFSGPSSLGWGTRKINYKKFNNKHRIRDDYRERKSIKDGDVHITCMGLVFYCEGFKPFNILSQNLIYAPTCFTDDKESYISIFRSRRMNHSNYYSFSPSAKCRF